MIEVKNLSYAIHNKQLLQDVNLTIQKNSFTVIMGANGAGKTTLLQLMAGSLMPSSGTIAIDGSNIASLSPEMLAKKRAVLSQRYHLPFTLTVREVVMMGRYPFFRNQPHAVDVAMVNHAMQQMHVTHLADTLYQNLSGGEAQKVQMCRVLAQIADASESQKKILFLDEPVSQLDVKYQYQLMQIAQSLTRQHVTVVAVLHDMNLALQFADTLHFMKSGQLLYSLQQPVDIDAALIKNIFDVHAIKLEQQNLDHPFIYFQPE
ncbi:ATP-binding cassette domain-containing protein [Hydrotalea sp.]|uniref:ATP-binding cassette domain-containing protein n=1 Tax=Hydrotalea sp. TaxID=2881279 RepID=UPI002588DF20|nr:ATP-binding cassette domain-containing protein [Hydrotalea sp.]